MASRSQGLQGQYAGFVSRTIAYVADMLIIVAIIAVVNGVIALALDLFLGVQVASCPPLSLSGLLSTSLLCHAANWLRIFLTIVVTPGYFAIFWALGGQTLGQYAMGLRVVRLDGRRMTFWRSLVRWFGYILSFVALGLGYLWVLWDDRRQGFADKLAKTVVVYAWEARQNEFVLDRIWHSLRRLRKTAATGSATPHPAFIARSVRLELVQAVFPTMARVREAMGVLQDAIRNSRFQLVTSVVIVKDETGALGFVGSSDLAAGDQSVQNDAVLASDTRLSRIDVESLTADIPSSSFVLWVIIEDTYLTPLLTTLTIAKVAAQVFDLDFPAHEPMSITPSDDASRQPIDPTTARPAAETASSEPAVPLISVLTGQKQL
jgi:uncharacterized RDD family membrane protein YckC